MPVEIDDELQSVAYVCVERDDDGITAVVPVGTAFFVLVAWQPNPQIAWVYAVTARHVLEDSGADDIYVRVNLKAGGFKDIATRRSNWHSHGEADVACLRIRADDFNIYDMKTIARTSFIDANYRYRDSRRIPALDCSVSVGQEVFFVGLFSQNYGTQQNLPVARFGNISRMPTKIRLPRWNGTSMFEAAAYLVESHSWGGQSGSPVFCLYPVSHVRMGPLGIGELQVAQSVEHGYLQAFLGLVSAHFTSKQRAETEGDILGSIHTNLNTGMVVVTPAHFIEELLSSDDLVTERERLAREESKDRG